MGTQRLSYEAGHKPKYLVVVDDTAEWDRAVYYASRRAARVGGAVLMLRIIEDRENSQEWLGVADIMRAMEGPLADVRGEAPENLKYMESTEALQDVWIALRANVRAVLETVTLQHLANQQLPKRVASLAARDDARFRR